MEDDEDGNDESEMEDDENETEEDEMEERVARGTKQEGEGGDHRDERAAGEREQEEDEHVEQEMEDDEMEERVARGTKQEGEGEGCDHRDERDSEDGIMLEESSDDETVCGAETMAREAKRRLWTTAQGDSLQKGREPVRHDEDGITSASEQAWKLPRLTANSLHP